MGTNYWGQTCLKGDRFSLLSAGPQAKRRRAFTLIELLVVIAIIGESSFFTSHGHTPRNTGKRKNTI